MSRAIFFLAFSICLVLPGAAWSETVYVKPDKANILSKPPGAGSSIIAVVRRDEPLSILEKAGKYYRVKTGKGVVGYIHRIRVTKTKPGGGDQPDDTGDELERLLSVLGGEGDKRTASMDERSSSHSIRGLKRKTTPGRSAVTARQAESFVSSMEKFSVSSKEIDKFQRDGKVGAYAK